MSDRPACLQPVSPNFRLKDVNPDENGGLSREEGEAKYLVLQKELGVLQSKFRAANDKALLLVLQAMDTGGKDGTIKKVVDAVDPQGVEVSAFKAPTPDELAHDFLWRIHREAPAKGTIGIFNRSQYEDVLIVRVKNYVPEKVWRKRYDQINEFEQLLNQTGTAVVKVFLYISKDEQRRRLQDRLDDPHKHWKFSVADLRERHLWEDYMAAYEDAIRLCNQPCAPWYVIPANKKWFRNWAITQILVNTLKELDPQYPKPDLTGVTITE
ncbi:MAG: PPK2 family polyphosphate kinase [bacterium]